MTGAVAVQVLDVLLAEDDPGDVLLAQEAFAQSAIPSQLHASAYVTKPTGSDLFTDAIRKVGNFCLALARLPH